MGAKRIACVVVLMWMAVAAPVSEAITCGEVSTKVQPCIGYLKTGGVVPQKCCGGIRALNSAAKTIADRQQACNCIKTAASQIPGINYGLAAGLPSKCGVSIPFKVSPNVDCSKVK